MIIKTERLIIKPLTYSQLLKYVKNDNSLEEELKLNDSNRIMSPELKEALESSILPNVGNQSKNYIFYTLWTLIDIEHNCMVGDFCFKGEPNENGELEIGYGTYEEFRNKGYMKEAIKGIIFWAEKQNNIKAITAYTEKTNIASYSILINNYFQQDDENEHLIKWIYRF